MYIVRHKFVVLNNDVEIKNNYLNTFLKITMALYTMSIYLCALFCAHLLCTHKCTSVTDFLFSKYNICAACLSLHVTQKPFLGTLKKCWRNNSWHLILLYIIRVINDQTFFATWQHNKSWIPITLLYEMMVNWYILGDVSIHSVLISAITTM